MNAIKAKDFNLRISSEIIENGYSVITNTDELDLPNEKKVYQIAKDEELLNDEDEVQVYQAELDAERDLINPVRDAEYNLFPLYKKLKSDITKLEL